MNNGGASVSYSVDELMSVALLMQTPRFPGIADEALAYTSQEVRDAALRSARRSLVARGVLELDGGATLTIGAPHAMLFAAALSPDIVVTAEHRHRDDVEIRSFYAVPDVTVEHIVEIGNVHRLTHFPTDELFQRLTDFLELTPGPMTELPECAFTMPLSVYQRVQRDFRSREGLDAFEIPSDGKPFIEALGSFMSSSNVRCLHRDGPRLVGGEVTWIDTDEAGIWLIETADSGEDRGPESGTLPAAQRVSLGRISAADLVEIILGFLPHA